MTQELEQQAAEPGDFLSGYNDDVPTETPEPVEVTEQEPEAKAAEPEAPVDPLQTVLSRLDRFEASQNSLAGHVGGLLRTHGEVQQLLAASKAATNKVDEAPTQAQVSQAMANPKEWDALKEEFPEWSSATEKLLDARLSTLPKPQQIDPAEIDRRVEARVSRESAAIREETVNAHLDAIVGDDWVAQVNTPEFAAFMPTLGAEGERLKLSPNLRDAATLLRKFQQYRTAPPEQKKQAVSAKQRQIEAAVSPKGNVGHTPTPTDKDEFRAGYDSA